MAGGLHPLSANVFKVVIMSRARSNPLWSCLALFGGKSGAQE